MTQNTSRIQKAARRYDYYFTTHLCNEYPNTQTCWSLDSRKFSMDIYLPSPKSIVEIETINLEMSNLLNFFKKLLINTQIFTCKRGSPYNCPWC